MTLGVDDGCTCSARCRPDDIADLYAAADLFVFPSTRETFGLAAVEAAMAGLPMVVADLPVLREVLRADGTEPVAFVKSHDVEGWIAAIGRALAAAKRHRLTHRPSPAPWVAKYSRQRMIESYLSLFEAQRSARAAVSPSNCGRRRKRLSLDAACLACRVVRRLLYFGAVADDCRSDLARRLEHCTLECFASRDRTAPGAKL